MLIYVVNFRQLSIKKKNFSHLLTIYFYFFLNYPWYDKKKFLKVEILTSIYKSIKRKEGSDVIKKKLFKIKRNALKNSTIKCQGLKMNWKLEIVSPFLLILLSSIQWTWSCSMGEFYWRHCLDYLVLIVSKGWMVWVDCK